MVDLLGTFRRYLSRGRLHEIYTSGGVARNTYYRGNICKSLPRDARRCLGSSPFASLFRGRNFFPLTIAIVPSCVPLLPRRSHSPFLFTSRAASASGIRYIRGSLCFMANCFIIFDIFPVYGRGSAFCFMAVYCAWWTSLYMPPWILWSTSGSCFIRETLVVSNTR